MQDQIANIRQKWAGATLTKSSTLWFVIGAIVFTLYIGFSRGGWMTESSAERLAETAAQDAVVERLTPMCVMQFDQDPQRDQKLAEMKLISSSYQRTGYIKDQGWATMPGEDTPDSSVATECAQQLMRLDE